MVLLVSHCVLNALLKALRAAAEYAGDGSTDKSDSPTDRCAYRSSNHQSRERATRSGLESSANLSGHGTALVRVDNSGCRNSQARRRLAESAERSAESGRNSANTGKSRCGLSSECCGTYRYRGLITSRKAQTERRGAGRERTCLTQNFSQQRNGTASAARSASRRSSRPTKRIEIPKKVTETTQKSGRTEEVADTAAARAARPSDTCNVHDLRGDVHYLRRDACLPNPAARAAADSPRPPARSSTRNRLLHLSFQ